MRIGIFTDAYYPIISGVSMSIDILTTELRKLNHEVVIITFEGKNAVPDDFIVRFKGKALPMNGLKDYKIAKVRNLLKVWTIFRVLIFLCFYLDCFYQHLMRSELII